MTIPKAEYERLCAVEEDLADLQAALALAAKIDAGAEELVPARIGDRLIDGEPPLRVWRETRRCAWETARRMAERTPGPPRGSRSGSGWSDCRAVRSTMSPSRHGVQETSEDGA